MTFDPNMHQYDELPEESEASNKSSVVSLSEQISPKSLLIEVNQQLSWDGQINLEDESSDDGNIYELLECPLTSNKLRSRN